MKTFFLLFLISVPCLAEENFPEGSTMELNAGDVWVETAFGKNSTAAKTRFRVWYPYPADQLWPALIDTNSWKEIHAEYSDSRTLDRNQYEMVINRKPSTIKGFYELVGDETFPSELNRAIGKTWISTILQRFNLPWPLRDRWTVCKIKNVENKAHREEYRYEYKSVAGNFKELKGYWEIVPIPDKPEWSEHRGEYLSDPGISVPQFLAKKIFKSSIRQSWKDTLKVLGVR